MTRTPAGVYYSLAVWRFEAILSAGLRFYSHLSGGLRLKKYRAVEGNHKFSSRFSVFTCFCGGYSNRVKRHRKLSGNFTLLKASLFNKALPFRARPNQSGLTSVLIDRFAVCGFEGTKYGGLRNVQPPIIDPHQPGRQKGPVSSSNSGGWGRGYSQKN